MAAVDGAMRMITSTARREASLLARDGQSIGVRVTEAIGTPKATLVYMNGTAGTARLFDGMADELAKHGVTSYSVTSRTHLDEAGGVLADSGFRIHADDLDRVVELAAREHPDTPGAIAGTSLGAVIAMHYNATRNGRALPVVAMSPVVLERFLPFADKLRLARGIASSSASGALVNTPMSVGRTMTTNHTGSEYITRAAEMAKTKVPARVFRDVLRMNLETALKGPRATGPLQVVLAGADQVGINASAKVIARRAAPDGLRAPVREIPGAPHELSQESHDPRVVNAILDGIGLRGATALLRA